MNEHLYKDNKTQRGGKRPGAGRPRGTGRLYAFRADGDVADYIDSHENKTDFIRECIRHRMDAAQTSPAEHLSEHSAAQPAPIRQLGTVMPATRVKPLTLPFFDIKVVAGFPIPLDNDQLAQDIEVLRMLCPHPDASYLIRVQGMSMIDAGVHDGDLVIVDKSIRHPTEKQIAVCELNGEYTLKRVLKRADGLWLVPANPDFPEIPITDGDDFRVWGVVTYIISKPVF